MRGICIARNTRKQLKAEEEEYLEYIRQQVENGGDVNSYKMVELERDDKPKCVRAIRSTAMVGSLLAVPLAVPISSSNVPHSVDPLVQSKPIYA